jgi:hypothetical protein
MAWATDAIVENRRKKKEVLGHVAHQTAAHYEGLSMVKKVMVSQPITMRANKVYFYAHTLA